MTDYEYLSKVDASLQCLVCHEPLVDPVVEPSCRVTFCRACLRQWLAKNRNCPNCRAGVTEQALHPAPLIITNALDALPVACPVCRSRQERGSLSQHVQRCPKPCAQGCGQRVAPVQVGEHAKTCQAVLVECPAADVGCTAKQLRRAELEAHVKSCSLVPLRPLIYRIRGLENEVTTLKQALRPRARFLRAWGTRGAADGQLSVPCGLAFVASGGGGGGGGVSHIIVADQNNHRVQVFNTKGAFVAKFGAEGSQRGSFYHPRGVAGLVRPDSGLFMLVADRDNHRIQVFNGNGCQATFGTQGLRDGQLQQPWGVVVDDRRGRVYVSDAGNHRVQAFDLKGQFLQAFGAAGDQPGQLRQPSGLAVDRHGAVWVADTDNHRVQVFDSHGRFQRSFGVAGAGEGRFQHPRDVVVWEESGGGGRTRVFVTDNHRVQVFDDQGQFLAAIGQHGTDEGCFDHPRGLAVDRKGRIFVADSANHRVQVFAFVEH